jgi:beta-lactam-binding protein with PASTA domain
MYLENLGLHIGDTTYRPDIAKNAILEQLYQGQPIKAGTKIFMGSSISFVLGSGVSDEELSVPDLIGKTYKQARSLMKNLNINYTPVIDMDVKDTANSFVTRQRPTKYNGKGEDRRLNRINPGQNIDIWLSTNPPVTDSTKTTAPIEDD